MKGFCFMNRNGKIGLKTQDRRQSGSKTNKWHLNYIHLVYGSLKLDCMTECGALMSDLGWTMHSNLSPSTDHCLGSESSITSEFFRVAVFRKSFSSIFIWVERFFSKCIWNLAEERNKDKEQFSFTELARFLLESLTKERTQRFNNWENSGLLRS